MQLARFTKTALHLCNWIFVLLDCEMQLLTDLLQDGIYWSCVCRLPKILLSRARVDSDSPNSPQSNSHGLGRNSTRPTFLWPRQNSTEPSLLRLVFTKIIISHVDKETHLHGSVQVRVSWLLSEFTDLCIHHMTFEIVTSVVHKQTLHTSPCCIWQKQGLLYTLQLVL